MPTRNEATGRAVAVERANVTDNIEPNFYVKLTDGINPVRGYGAPSFSRTTSAWVFNNLGNLYEVPSGSARIQGARMVYNRLPKSEDLSTNWVRRGTCSITAGQTDPNGKTTAYRVDGINTTGVDDIYLSVSSSLLVPGTPLYFGFWVKRVSTTGTLRCMITTGATYGSLTVDLSALPDGWVYVDINSPYAVVVYPFKVSNTNGCGVAINASAGGPLSVHVWGLQIYTRSVVNESSPDYVSRGVLTTSPYHGTGADGVKVFLTDQSGNPIDEKNVPGYLIEGTRTNNLFYCRDLTQSASWVVTNMTTALNAQGIDANYNGCTTLTATANNATILQTFVMAAADRTFSAFVKRVTGTGKIYITRNGGTNWTDVTDQINSRTFTRVYISKDSVTDPVCGFKIETSGDEIAVDFCQDEAGNNYSSPIFTSSATVTRNADVLTYSSNNLHTDKNTCAHESVASDDLVLDRRSIAYTASNNTRAQWVTHNGATTKGFGYYGTGAGLITTGANGGTINDPAKSVLRWENGDVGSAFVNGKKLSDTAGTVSVTPTTIDVGGAGLGAHLYGCVKNVRIWAGRKLTDDQCITLTQP